MRCSDALWRKFRRLLYGLPPPDTRFRWDPDASDDFDRFPQDERGIAYIEPVGPGSRMCVYNLRPALRELRRLDTLYRV